MERIINVTGGIGGNAFLILGEKKTALVDCGMAYCASNLISNIKQVLNKRTLNDILISHSHYDHIGAIPYLKETWPNSKVFGAEHAKQILNRPNALKTIRNFSMQAAKLYGGGNITAYHDEMLKVDNSIFEGDILELGGLDVKVIETLGHTKCSLAFLVNNEILFASESTGYMSKSGKVYPGFLTSSAEAIASITRCQNLNPRFIISPHFGLVNNRDTLNYWENCISSIKETKAFILHLSEMGYGDAQILIEYEKSFRDELSRLEQPISAFNLNIQNMINTVLSER